MDNERESRTKKKTEKKDKSKSKSVSKSPKKSKIDHVTHKKVDFKKKYEEERQRREKADKAIIE